MFIKTPSHHCNTIVEQPILVLSIGSILEKDGSTTLLSVCFDRIERQMSQSAVG